MPIETTVVQPARRGPPLWPWLLGGGGLLLGLGAWRLRRGRDDDGTATEPPFAAPEPSPSPVGPVPSLFMPKPARLALTVRPTRAGLNLISVTVDCEVTIANTGETAAEDIRTDTRLFSMGGDQEGALAAFYAEPLARGEVLPFALAPGEVRRFRAVAAVAHDAIHTFAAGGRPMFVPLVAVSARYVTGGTARRAGRAFAIGIERVDSPKLAPFWLDAGPKQYDGVAARAHGAGWEGDA